MTRRRWLFHLLIRSLSHRKGRTLLLLVVLAMASSLATALGIVSFSMGKRVAAEVRKYGANLVVLPETARLDVGSGGLNFGVVSDPAYLRQSEVEASLTKSGLIAERSLVGAKVTEVRQIARTSEGLLVKVKLLMTLVTVVVLISAGSSVAGTMSTTVLERGKEIGLMKAMGGSRWELLRLFSAEAALLGLVGGVAGYLLGSCIAQFITKSVFSASADFIPWFALVSLGVSLFLALLGSLGPMMSVFRLDPVRSLRGE